MLVVIDEGFKRHLGKKVECPICFNEKSLVPVCEWGHLVCEDCGPNLNMQKCPLRRRAPVTQVARGFALQAHIKGC